MATALAVPRKRALTGLGRALRRPQTHFALVVLVPCFAFYIYFVYRPIVFGLWLSLYHYGLLNPSHTSTFAGLGNFDSLFTYDRFWTAMRNTLIYTVLVYALTIPTALLLAWCISTIKRGRRLYEFVVFLPVVVSLVAIALLFRMLMDPQVGGLNMILHTLGLPTSQWIFGSDTALYSVILVDYWKGFGFYVILLLGGMLAVPEVLYDAAKVDGASHWRLFWHITLPGIMPIVLFVSIIAAINGLQVYVTPTVLGPGPGTSTLVLNQFIVATAFTEFNIGLATAASAVLFAIVLVLTLVQLRILRPQSDGAME